MPAFDRASFTSSSLNGLMIASIFFITLLWAPLRPREYAFTCRGGISNGGATPTKDGEDILRSMEQRRIRMAALTIGDARCGIACPASTHRLHTHWAASVREVRSAHED